MTLEECKKLHKDMWEFVKEQENLTPEDRHDTPEDRHDIKKKYCAENDLHLVHNCSLCNYAQQKAIEQHNDVCTNICQYCPAIWGSETSCDSFYCESGIDGYLNWWDSPCDDIIGIKWKDEVE